MPGAFVVMAGPHSPAHTLIASPRHLVAHCTVTDVTAAYPATFAITQEGPPIKPEGLLTC
ncbi:hypothetical protein SAMN04488590_3103 [Microbacterium sp. 77mftsu3.1]|nr:hypothetical protein SAMN04488590_3103 [Microbacterium sp. 77mftsu3.1]